MKHEIKIEMEFKDRDTILQPVDFKKTPSKAIATSISILLAELKNRGERFWNPDSPKNL